MIDRDNLPPTIAMAVELPDPEGPAIRVGVHVTGRHPLQAGIYWTRTPGAGLRSVGASQGTSVLGEVDGALAAGPLGQWDPESSIEVEVYGGDLESVASSEVIRGENLAMVGREVVGFTEAELVAEHRYRLSGLLRGLLDTEDEVGRHAPGERFLLLDDSLVRVPYPAALFGDRVHLKAVRSMESITDTPDFAAVDLEGLSARPRPPADLRAWWVDDALEVSWWRRSRHPNRTLGDPAIEPMDEPFVRFELLVELDGYQVRSAQVEGRRRWTYTLADLADDGVDGPFRISVAQMGAWGVGRPATVEVELP